METVLGLDLGTNSVGWALVTRHEDRDRPEIEAGVYVFPEGAEMEKDGTRVSERFKRGQKRRARRQLRRKRDRMRDVLRVLVQNELLPQEPGSRADLMSSDRIGGTRPYHPFVLRKKGLDEALTPYEFGRCIHHIARRRGYLSTRDLIQKHFERRLGLEAERSPHLDDTSPGLDPDEDRKPDKEEKEKSKLLGRLAEVRAMVEAGQARTVGELCADILLAPDRQANGVRAGGKRKDGRRAKEDPLGWRTDRMLYEEEFELLWDIQQGFHPTLLTRGLRDALRHAIFYQRPLMSKHSLIGGCEFFPKRKRLPRAALLAQRCSILQDLLNLKVSSAPGLPERRLRPEEVRALADELDRKDAMSWDEMRDLLGLGSDARFSAEPATAGKRVRKGKSARSKPDIRGNRTMAIMRKALGEDRWNGFAPEQQEEIVNRLLYAFYPHNVIAGLVRDFGLTTDEVRALAAANLPEGYTNHCHRVWAELEKHMRNGLVYSEACEAAGFREPHTSTVKQPEKIVDRLGGLPDLRNPVVQRSAKMAFRVINAVLDRYGKPDRIRIEMPRDVARTNKQREVLWKRQDEEHRKRQAAEKLLTAHNLPLGSKGENIRKVLLWEEAGCRCPYEPDVEVGLQQLVYEYTIEHIVPRSRCWDDSWPNLTICPMGLNLQKGDRTPYEWLGQGPRWEAVERHVTHLRTMHPRKRQRILRKDWKADEFTNRALVDTRYLSKVIHGEVARLGVPVDVSPGAITASLRRQWELEGCVPSSAEEQAKLEDWKAKPVKKQPKPRYDHRHHAVDAIVTALTDPGTLQRLSAWYKERDRGVQSNRIPAPGPKPWPTIREDVLQLIDTMPVVYAQNRGVSGALHKETALKPPEASVVRAALAGLPPRRDGRPHESVVVGGQLVRVAPDGTPLAAYNLRYNHHAVIWEKEAPEADGARRREMTVVSMMEAARRACEGRPVFDRTPPREGWRYVMALCNDDVIEWRDSDHELRRIAYSSCTESGRTEVALARMTDATAKGPRERVEGSKRISQIVRRVCLDPLGRIIASEPPDADGR